MIYVHIFPRKKCTLFDALFDLYLTYLFIAHDIAFIRTMCHKVVVMYKGDIVEELDAFHLADAKHPYTKVLLSSIFEIGKPHNPLSMDTVTNDTNI